jgi:hypothetical protein
MPHVAAGLRTVRGLFAEAVFCIALAFAVVLALALVIALVAPPA